MIKICVALKAQTTSQTIRDVLRAEEADLIELRLDYRTEKINLKEIRSKTSKPLIATNRVKTQGGFSEEPEQDRIELLLEAASMGFDYVDLSSSTENLASLVEEIHNSGAKVIASHHNHSDSLSLDNLVELHKNLVTTGADIIKIIGWANEYGDNLSYLEYNKLNPGNIAFAMGETGIPSRILAPLSGAAYTYASLEEKVAPGQIPLKQLKETYRCLMP